MWQCPPPVVRTMNTMRSAAPVTVVAVAGAVTPAAVARVGRPTTVGVATAVMPNHLPGKVSRKMVRPRVQ